MEVQDIRAAQRGDPAAMHALVAELAPWVGRICGSIALERGDDAMQETFVAVLRNLPALREPAAIRGWVRRIAVREAVRVASHGREVLVAELPDVGQAETDMASGADVRAVLAALPPAHRAVLVLRHVEDLSEAETADLLRVEPGTVKSRLHRARAAFQEKWTR